MSSCDGDNQSMEEDGDLLDSAGGGDACDLPTLKKDDSILSNKSDETETVNSSPHLTHTSVRDESGWLDDIAITKSGDDNDPFSKKEDMHVDICDANDSKLFPEIPDGAGVGGDVLLNLDTEIEMNNPVNVSAGSYYVGTVTSSYPSSSSPCTKRVNAEDEDSPKPKRPTPDRSEAVSESEEVRNETEMKSSSPDHASESQDSDDDSSPLSAARKRLIKRRNLRRLFRPRRPSSDDSDDSFDADDDDDGDGTDVNNPYGDEMNDEIRTAVSSLLEKPSPTPNWYAVSELRKREYGYVSSCESGCFM